MRNYKWFIQFSSHIMSFTPLNFTTSADLYAYANWFHVASVMIMCNGDNFNFLATYDHKGYYGTFAPPLMKRSYFQEEFNDTDENVTEPIEPPVEAPVAPPTSSEPPMSPLCISTNLSNIELEIATIELDDGSKGLTPQGGMLYNTSIFRGGLQKIHGSFYKYGKKIFNVIQPYDTTYFSTLIGIYKFTGMLSGGEFTLYQLPSLPASNWVITSVGFVNGMFKTWQTETELVV